jgi:DNA-binding beta-propeller fold protein YncE
MTRKNSTIKNIARCVLGLMFSASLYAAAQPKFLIVPITPVLNITTNIVQYRVTNQTKITRTLRMVNISGATQVVGGQNSCGILFPLAHGQSCLLTLRVTSSLVNTPIEVCKTNYNNNEPDPFLCSKTSANNNLNVTLPSPSRQLVSVPKEITLTANGDSKTMTIKNLSRVTTVKNIRADFSETALNGNVTQDASNCTSLAPGETCDLTFIPGSQAVSLTLFPIQGDNSAPTAAAIAVVSSGIANISISGNPLVLDVGSSGTLTVTNNSSQAATNVAANLTAQQQASLTQNAVGCTNLAAFGTCELNFSGTAVLSPEAMFITGTDASLTASGVAVNAPSQIALQISAGSPLQLKADGMTTGTMTITNFSTTDIATDVQASFSNTNLSGKVTATSCSQILPSSSCTMTFTPGIVTVEPTNFTISGSNTTAVTGSIAINSFFVYITNQGPTGEKKAYVRVCSLSQSDGSITGCSTSNALPSLFTISGVAFNSAANRAYFISGIPPTVTDCHVDITSGNLSNCKNTVLINNNSLNGNGVVYNPFLGTLYVTISGTSGSSSDSYVYQCTLDSSGSVASCNNGDTGANNLTYPTGISLNPAGTLAYIANYSSSNAVVSCDIDPSSGNFSNCTQNTAGDYNNGIAVNPANTFVYASGQPDNVIRQCTIDSSNNGTISSCSNVSLSWQNPTGMALNPVTNFLYVSNGTGNQVKKCTVSSSNGSVSGCDTNSGATTLQFPIGVGLYPTPPQ